MPSAGISRASRTGGRPCALGTRRRRVVHEPVGAFVGDEIVQRQRDDLRRSVQILESSVLANSENVPGLPAPPRP